MPVAGPEGLIKRHDRPQAFLPMNILRCEVKSCAGSY